MSKEINEALSDLAAQLAEQLRFYREIGITEIGGSAIPAKWAASADPVVAASLNILISDDEAAEAALTAASEHQREKLMPKKQPPVEQARLFGDSSFKSGEAASPLTQPVEPQDASLEAIREDLGECVRCKLHEHRTNIVFGEGSPESKIVFVGEGPGADEDATGRPFV